MQRVLDITRVAVLEERMGNIEDDVRETRIDVKSILDKINAVELRNAEESGATKAMKYITHASSSLIGALLGILGVKHL